MRSIIATLLFAVPAVALADGVLPSPVPNIVNGQFGWMVAAVPDLTGDGADDLAVSGVGMGGVTGAASAGRVYLYDGRTLAQVRLIHAPDEQASALFGWGLAGISDVTGDGKGDLVVGASLLDIGGTQNVGRAYIINGATGAVVTPINNPTPASPQFGRFLAVVPDQDGDGKDDVIIRRTATTASTFSSTTGSLIATMTAPAGSTLGTQWVVLPDETSDGRGEVAVVTTPSSGAARVDVYAGGALTPLRSLSIGAAPQALYGVSIALVPDWNGADSPAIALTTSSALGTPPAEGYVVRVIDAITGTVVRVFNDPAPSPHYQFGVSLLALPDLNANGSSELLVAKPYEPESAQITQAGRVFIYDPLTGEELYGFRGLNPAKDSLYGLRVAVLRGGEAEHFLQLAAGEYMVANGFRTSVGRVTVRSLPVFQPSTGSGFMLW